MELILKYQTRLFGRGSARILMLVHCYNEIHKRVEQESGLDFKFVCTASSIQNGLPFL